MLEEIAKMLGEQLDVDPATITADTDIIKDLGADSLDVVELLMGLEEKTGKTVEVVTPTTFDTVEEILTAVERDKADYDLLLPSDYAVEQLIKKGLVQKIDTERVNISEIMKPEYVERARISDPTLEYSVPYMYGTFGIMYDYSRTGKHIDSWSAIFTDEYSGKSANKDSLREALTSAAIWNNRESLLDGEYDNAKLQAIYEDMSEDAFFIFCPYIFFSSTTNLSHARI